MTTRLDHQGFLQITGTDAVTFMQGYTTCDLPALEPGAVMIGAVCNIQGRMVTSFAAIREGDDILMRMHRTLVTSTIEFLSKYIVFSKAELHDLSDQLVCYGSSACEQTPMTVTHNADTRTLCFGNRSEYWTPNDLESDSAVQDFQQLEVDAGVAWVSDASADEYLPQMFNYHNQNAIDFEKGCYLGQEIVARAHYRGELKRKLHRLEFSLDVGESLPTGQVVATGSSASLAVLKNASEDPISVELSDGTSIEATPV